MRLFSRDPIDWIFGWCQPEHLIPNLPNQLFLEAQPAPNGTLTMDKLNFKRPVDADLHCSLQTRDQGRRARRRRQNLLAIAIPPRID